MMAFSKLFGRRPVDDAAHGLYTAAVAQSRQLEFFEKLGVADTLDGRFDLLCLHIFLILHRLGEGGRPYRAVSQAVFDLMFADMDQNLRELGVSDIAVGGRVKTMAQAFYGRVDAYEPGLADAQLLAEALRRNLYRGVDVGESCLAAMASYVQQEARGLASQDLEQLKEGRVRFGAPPSA